MNRLFQLWDRPDSEHQFPHLSYVLSGLPPEARSWPWHIAWLEPVPLRKFGIDIREYIAADRQTTPGWPARFEDLETIASGTLQINDGLIVVPYAGATPARPTDPDLSIFSSSAVALVPFDTSYWNLWVPESWADHLRSSFTDLREVTPGHTPLMA